MLGLLGRVLEEEKEKHRAGAAWAASARPNQLPPDGDWFVWLILAGRGWGKTRAAAELCASWARQHPGARVALVAATFADGRDTMVEGDSGLLSVFDDHELRGGDRDAAWNRSHGELFLRNGTRFKVYSSEKASRLRGPQHHFAWCDEIAQWTDAGKGVAKDTTWSNLLMGIRLPAQDGWPAEFRPRIVVATTPKPVPLLRVPAGLARREPSRKGIMQRPDTVLTSGSSTENMGNLSQVFLDAVIAPLQGTTLGRQELDGEFLEDFEGAFLLRKHVEGARVTLGEVRQVLASSPRVIAVDPAVTDREGSDETGIIAACMGYDGNFYVLGDVSLKGSPETWSRAAWAAYHHFGASTVVVEDNQGGDMVETTLLHAWEEYVRWRDEPELRSPGGMVQKSSGLHHFQGPGGLARPLIQRVHPSGAGQGKWVRAQPLRLMYEQGKVFHVVIDEEASFDKLEDQLTMWTGDAKEKSPDRIDALAHAFNYLAHPAERRGNRYGADPVQRSRWGTMRGR